MKENQKPEGERKSLLFLTLAISFLVFIDLVIFGGWRPYYPSPAELVFEDVVTLEQQSFVYEEYFPESNNTPALILEHGDQPAERKVAAITIPEDYDPDQTGQDSGEASLESIHILDLPPMPDPLAKPQEDDKPRWLKNAVTAKVPEGFSKVVIIIDDVGMNVPNSNEVINISAPLTLAFLPYADHTAEMADRAHASGHEIMIHMPMQPMNNDIDTGPIVLKTGMGTQEFDDMYEKALGSLDHFVGINNHMGSRLTQDYPSMLRLMARLKRDGMLFVDSRTISTSIADKVATNTGVPHIARDVFLDHDPSLEAVRSSLAKLELIAKTEGYAVAIGHPKDNTIKALQEWIPTLKGKKIALVPVSAVVKTPVNPGDKIANADIPKY